MAIVIVVFFYFVLPVINNTDLWSDFLNERKSAMVFSFLLFIYIYTVVGGKWMSLIPTHVYACPKQ